MQGARVWSLVEGLRSRMLLGVAKKKIKINKIARRKKWWGVKDAEEWKAKRWDWVEGESLAVSVQKRMLWKEGLAFGVGQVQSRWAQEAGPGSWQGDQWVWLGLAAPHCTKQLARMMLADSREIRTNREAYLPQGQDTGLISFRNNEPFISKIKTDSNRNPRVKTPPGNSQRKKHKELIRTWKDSWSHA